MSTDLHDLRASDPKLDALASYIQASAAAEASLLTDQELGAQLPSKVLVTGSSGYLGAAIAQALRLRGIEVVGLDLRAGPSTGVIAAVEDEAAVAAAIAGCGGVVHTAALHAPHAASHSEADFRRVNVGGTAAVLRAAALRHGCAVVCTSTTSLTITPDVQARQARGECVWLDERSTPCGGDLPPEHAPRNKYGRTKRAAELLCQEAAPGTAVVELRVSRCFPEDVLETLPEPMALANIKCNELLGRRVALVDVVDAHLRALARAPALGRAKFTLCAAFPWPREATPAAGVAVAQMLRRERPGAAAVFEARGWRLPGSVGRVYDASASEAFRETYGATWAGRDASVALALMSLEERDAGRLDWHCLRPEDRQALRDWRAYFDQRLLDI